MNDICNDPELTKLFYAFLKVNKAGRYEELENYSSNGCVRFKNPSKEKIFCAIEGDEELEKAIDVIQNYKISSDSNQENINGRNNIEAEKIQK